MNRAAIHETGVLLLALALILVALCLLPSAESAPARPSRVQLEAMAEAYHRQPGGLLARAIAYEASGDVVRKRYRKDGSWFLVCGPFQINAGQSWRLCRMARGVAGIWIAAELLAESRGKAQAGWPCPWAAWNWGDRTAMCASLEAK